MSCTSLSAKWLTNCKLHPSQCICPKSTLPGKKEFFRRLHDRITKLEGVNIGRSQPHFKESERRNRLYTSNVNRIGKVNGCHFRDANLVDIWSNQTELTWRRPNTDSFSTLHRILYRSELLKREQTQIDWSLGFSDHAAVKIGFVAIGAGKKVGAS